MPRPTRTRAAVTRATPAARDPSLPPAALTPDDNTDMQDASDHDKGKQVLRRSSRGTSRASSVPNSRQAVAGGAARQRRDSSLQRPDKATNATSFASTTAARTDFSDDDDSEVEVEMGRRAVAATPAHGRLNDVSGLDLDDDMFDDLNTSFDTAGPASAQGSAQRSYNSSTLSTSHFKRRPRAGSFLSRDDGTLRPSSRAGPNTPGVSSTFNIGVFKRRRREPSILGTAQKPRAERPMPRSETGDRTEDEAEEGQAEGDASAPEDESTPLRRSIRRSGAAAAETDPDLDESSGTNPRKRKSTEAHQQRARSSPHIDAVAAEQSDSDALSSPPSSPPVVDRPMTSFDEEDIAPPMSSGSDGEADLWPPLQSLARGRSRRRVSVSRHTPVREVENVSDISSPPSLTYSPNYADGSPPPAKQTRRAASKPSKKITTADLTGLLPRRRHRGARGDALGSDMSEDEEVDASGLANDEDELSYINVQSRRRPGRSVSRARTANKGTTRGKPAQSKPKTPGSAKPARTYGRSSDKENQEQDGGASDAANEDPFASDAAAGPRNGDELKNAVKKFAEVDKWELEFEECTQSSSPTDAR